MQAMLVVFLVFACSCWGIEYEFSLARLLRLRGTCTAVFCLRSAYMGYTTIPDEGSVWRPMVRILAFWDPHEGLVACGRGRLDRPQED